ncbi:hypothetical protein CPAV1605_1156 [seawater metagenome]|uniref:Uncharacterized protein n=1 Tax=seawater metagenome TaxID=1561972 RepID=A0A5E8CLW9_9ZZZZ
MTNKKDFDKNINTYLDEALFSCQKKNSSPDKQYKLRTDFLKEYHTIRAENSNLNLSDVITNAWQSSYGTNPQVYRHGYNCVRRSLIKKIPKNNEFFTNMIPDNETNIFIVGLLSSIILFKIFGDTINVPAPIEKILKNEYVCWGMCYLFIFNVTSNKDTSTAVLITIAMFLISKYMK